MEKTNIDNVETARHSAVMLSNGVTIPEGGISEEDAAAGWHQYTTRMETRPDPSGIDDEATYLKWKWRMNLANPATGLDNNGLREGVQKIADESGWKDGKEDWYDVSARCFDFLVDKVQIGFSEFDYFPAVSTWDRHVRPMSAILWSHAADVDQKYSPDMREKIGVLNKEFRSCISKDFDHSAPDWDDIFAIGFPGMKTRIDSYEKNTPFYRAEKRSAAAMMRFLDRLVAECEAEKARVEAKGRSVDILGKTLSSLKRLRNGVPETVFDLMNFTMVYFILSEPLNYFQIRTLGNIDRLWWPYYQRDIAAGRTTEEEFRKEFHHFLWQFGSIDNYWGHPIYLGGVNLDGRAAYNPMSMIILDQVEKTALPTPKFQLKFGPDTPDEIWWKSLDMLRKHMPIMLMDETNMMRSMKPVGLPEEDAKDLLIWGCFEYLPRAKGNCTSASRVILPQPVVEIMAKAAKGEFTADTFEEFLQEYFRILKSNTDRTMELVTENERHSAEVNPALMLSLTIKSALDKGEDAFSTGFTYNYSTISECGFATAVDSLLSVKEFVYDKRLISLSDFGQVLASDWNGNEDFRLRVKRSAFKWGCGNDEADQLAKRVIEAYTSNIVGKPNGRGGKYVVYGLQARGFINSRGLPATPDGRKCGDYLSKNMAPNTGAETEGISGSLKSFSVIAPENFPCGSIYDVMIHPSIAGGEHENWSLDNPDKPLRIFRMLVERFFKNGGVAMNITIVSPETLRDAQKHPDKYENLQIRVAGWNVRWNDIPRREQDEFIARIECVGA